MQCPLRTDPPLVLSCRATLLSVPKYPALTDLFAPPHASRCISPICSIHRKRDRHPVALFFLFFFRTAAIVTYLLCGFFSNSCESPAPATSLPVVRPSDRVAVLASQRPHPCSVIQRTHEGDNEAELTVFAACLLVSTPRRFLGASAGL